MDWTNAITLAGVFLGAATAAYVGYSKRWPAKPDNPVLTGIGIGFGDREQSDRMNGYLGRIATALEILADRRTEEMEDIHRELLERLDRREEQEAQKPRRPQTPRRR